MSIVTMNCCCLASTREGVLNLLSNVSVAAAVAAANREGGGAGAPWLLGSSSSNSSLASQIQSMLMQSASGSTDSSGMGTEAGGASLTPSGSVEDQARKQQLVDLGKAMMGTETRNPSTESTGSSSTVGAVTHAAANSEGSIPRKQDIQTDIRMNRGRFRLQVGCFLSCLPASSCRYIDTMFFRGSVDGQR